MSDVEARAREAACRALYPTFRSPYADRGEDWESFLAAMADALAVYAAMGGTLPPVAEAASGPGFAEALHDAQRRLATLPGRGNERFDAALPWDLVDETNADPDVGFPGDLVSSHPDRRSAEVARTALALAETIGKGRTS